MNIMRNIKVEKVTLNFGAGKENVRLEKGVKLLKKLTGIDPVKTVTMKRIPTWGVRPGLQIGCKVTLRGKKAEEILIMLLKAVDNRIPASKFDDYGSFSFGIKEYIDIQEIEYIPEIGIIGFEAAVTLARPGFRVKARLKSSRLGKKHKITKQEAISFMEEKFNLNKQPGA